MPLRSYNRLSAGSVAYSCRTMSQRTRVPEQEALAIRYPGYVQSAEAALDTMGGLNAIERAHFDGGANYVQVNCRPG